MPMITRCCFSRNLRIGSIASGIWTLVTCSLSISVTIKNYAYLLKETDDPRFHLAGYSRSAELAVSWFGMIFASVSAISCVVMIVGVIKDKYRALLPYLIMTVLIILYDVISIIWEIVVDGLSTVIIIIMILWIVITLINIYCLLCVISHYQELKIGRGRGSDYSGTQSARYLPDVQHVHIGDGPINYVQSQHTIYSFHSQNFYEDEDNKATAATNGHAVNINTPAGSTALSNCNGRVLELRPVSSMPSGMDSRFSKKNGSIVEMRIVDAMPVALDRRNIDNYTGSLEFTPVTGKRPRRFRTVSESAVRQQMVEQSVGNNSACNSMQNINEQRSGDKEKATSALIGNGTKSDSAAKSEAKPKPTKKATFALGNPSDKKDQELSPLTGHKEEDEEEES